MILVDLIRLQKFYVQFEIENPCINFTLKTWILYDLTCRLSKIRNESKIDHMFLSVFLHVQVIRNMTSRTVLEHSCEMLWSRNEQFESLRWSLHVYSLPQYLHSRIPLISYTIEVDLIFILCHKSVRILINGDVLTHLFIVSLENIQW